MAPGSERADRAMDEFASLIGPVDRVAVAGGRTQWSVGGELDPDARLVEAPQGIRSIEPDELVVRVGLGTPVAQLQSALAESGQFVALPTSTEPEPGETAPFAAAATVGGALAVGRSGPEALGYGPVRDTVLSIRYVDAWGQAVTAGGATVKNVSGFDLCRLLVGSLGTIGLMGEAILRTRPVPAATRWFTGDGAPREVWRVVAPLRPTAVLWDGVSVWVRLDGHHADLTDAESALRRVGCGEACAAPPDLPPHRRSLPPAQLWRYPAAPAETFVAELGRGIVHSSTPPAPRQVPGRVAALHRAVKQRFDPTGRLSPGRDVMATSVTLATT